MLRAFGASEKGPVRSANEDCFAIHEDLGVCIVADGLGGHNAGEVAARIAVDAVSDYLRDAASASSAGPMAIDGAEWPFGFDPSLSPDGNRLRTAILLANVQILEAAITTDGYAGMGTTVVVTRVVDGRLIVGHVGDSRLYLFARDMLRQVTDDDSWMATMLARDPGTDPLWLQYHPMRHALTNVVGARARTDVHVVEETVEGGEVLLLTTDGVHGVMDDRRLEQLLRRDQDPKAAATNIVATALARGTRDNCTAVVAVCPSRPWCPL